jgi:hypothetical protein
MASPEPWCRIIDTALSISGDLDASGITRFEAEIAALPLLPDPLRLDLSGFDISDGLAAVAAVDAMRGLARGRRLVLLGAPQLLAHNLYRVGDLEGGSLVLEATRQDEPYG